MRKRFDYPVHPNKKLIANSIVSICFLFVSLFALFLPSILCTSALLTNFLWRSDLILCKSEYPSRSVPSLATLLILSFQFWLASLDLR